jgi:hypothetical protein
MTPTDAIVILITRELEFWRPMIDARAGQLDCIRVVVNLNKRTQMPRSIVVSPGAGRMRKRAVLDALLELLPNTLGSLGLHQRTPFT